MTSAVATRSREGALRQAIRTFTAGNRVEISDLAAELGVNRVTIYRWLGERDAILSEIVWRLGERTLHNAYEHSTALGGARIADTVSTFVRRTLADAGMRAFLTNETDTALRVLTNGRHTFQPRLIGALEALIRRELHAGTMQIDSLDVHDLAYLAVRVGESFVYTDSITGEIPDPDRADRALRYLFR